MIELETRLFVWLRSSRLCYRLTLFTRVLLAAAFIPTGMVKLLGHRFSGLPVDDSIGLFFEALYRTGVYWRFLGASQILAGSLLLWPRTAHLGAALFLPIATNILVITVAMPFGGTPFVTGPMFLAVLYLCAWDFHRFRSMITLSAHALPLPVQRLDVWEKVGFTGFAISTVGFFAVTRGFVAASLGPTLIGAGFLSGLLTLSRFVWNMLLGRMEQRGRRSMPSRVQ